jgi:hypothetical protein
MYCNFSWHTNYVVKLDLTGISLPRNKHFNWQDLKEIHYILQNKHLAQKNI